MAKILPGGQFHMSPSAAHAPFLSHPGEFTDRVTEFLEDGA